MVSMSSTLVETVSINYEDFNESFLTCGTCLCMYDGQEHTPKLLPCSHTVCLQCLGRIADSQTRDTGSFRCPICRELFHIPRGGVSAIPPSFLVNQLLDLMSRQRREVIPKCSEHINQELLFCETCDTVFCMLCTGGNHSAFNAPTCEHTIIPFSIAMKRMSEILLFKSKECLSRLTLAHDSISAELRRLTKSSDYCVEEVNSTFDDIAVLLETRRLDLMTDIRIACYEKKHILDEQLKLIASERAKMLKQVELGCEGLQYQMEVRNITQRIESLSEKIEAATLLSEPNENSFLTCEFDPKTKIEIFSPSSYNTFGKVRSSTTNPSLCTAAIEGEPIAQLEAIALVTTVDNCGTRRTTGGDPILADINCVGGIRLAYDVIDCDDGSYKVKFRPPTSGEYTMKVSVFERPIKNSPVIFEVTEHNNPVATFGYRGLGNDEFLQPVAVASRDSCIYVVDTGNSRIKVLDENLNFLRHIENEGLCGRSCTGIASSKKGLVLVNWRSKLVTEINTDGDTLMKFTYNLFQEPIDVAVDPNYGRFLVADNGQSSIFAFDRDGNIMFEIGKKGTENGSFNLISSVTVSRCSDIIVADSRLQVFDEDGRFLSEMNADGKGHGRYGGVIVDKECRVLATRSEKNKNFIQVIDLEQGLLLSTIDSNDSKLKRPTGVAVCSANHLVVVDLGNNCIKKYMYW